MQYHIAKNGENSGPFDREEVYRRLVSGELTGNDLGWCAGMAEWETLSKLIPPPAAGAAPVFGPASTARTPMAPAGSSGMAVASMICGILSFFTIGVTSIPAIITGHMSLSRIKKAAGALGGRGMAVAGLVMGYIGLLLLGVMILSIGSISLLRGQIDMAKDMRTMSDIQAISLALMSYESRAQRLPTTEQGLKVLVEKPTTEPIPASWRAFMADVPKDPWGREYEYRFPAQRSGKDYDLFSVGPDGQEGTPDDVGNWKK